MHRHHGAWTGVEMQWYFDYRAVRGSVSQLAGLSHVSYLVYKVDAREVTVCCMNALSTCFIRIRNWIEMCA
jgi:hypothetical protein